MLQLTILRIILKDRKVFFTKNVMESGGDTSPITLPLLPDAIGRFVEHPSLTYVAHQSVTDQSNMFDDCEFGHP